MDGSIDCLFLPLTEHELKRLIERDELESAILEKLPPKGAFRALSDQGKAAPSPRLS